MNRKIAAHIGLFTPMMITGANAATLLEVTYTGLAPTSNAPVAGVFHDGSFDSFAVGSPASSGLETLAEVGNPAGFLGGAPAGANTGTNGAPFGAGTTATFMVSVDDGNSLFSFASMVLASNDWFIGNSTPFDVAPLLGGMLGMSSEFQITTVYDAGTESEDFAFSAGNPFIGVPGGDAAGGDTLTDPIAAVSGGDPFAQFANAPAGFNSADYDFNSGPIGTLTVTVVPEPSAALLGLLGLLPLLRRRR